MDTVNALRIRNHFGEVLEMLDNGKEPILITKGRKIRAVLIRYEDFQTRFLDKQANEKRDRFFAQIKGHVLPSLINQDSVQTLREFRGYKD
jgi:antitoxin (DNA-binding transcriptional repressor) of toxin-antitoxin stability system